MLEWLKGINLTGPEFIVPVIIGVVLLFIVFTIAKKLIKLALFVVVIALAITFYFNMPSFTVDGSVATLKVQGNEYTIDAKDVKIEKESVEGKEKVFLVSGSTRIELPFSLDFAEKFIMEKLNRKE